MTNPFCGTPFQSEDARPALLGGAFGLSVLGGLWLASTRGAAIPQAEAMLACVAAYLLGAGILLWDKWDWSKGRAWWTELLGACLAGPLCIAFVFASGILPLPWDHDA